MTALLTVSGLTMSYGALTAVNAVSFELRRGQFMGLIGPNGSGKSSLLKCLAGAQVPTRGHIHLGDADVTKLTPAERAILGLALKFQITSVFSQLTVYDNLLVARQAGDRLLDLVLSRSAINHQSAVEKTLRQFFLFDQADCLASQLSHGQQQWLEIAMALCREPRVLLLDEPTAGMSPQERRMTGQLLSEIREKTALIIVEHDLDFVCDICDQLAVLDQGQLIAVGETKQIQDDERVRDIYIKHG